MGLNCHPPLESPALAVIGSWQLQDLWARTREGLRTELRIGPDFWTNAWGGVGWGTTYDMHKSTQMNT